MSDTYDATKHTNGTEPTESVEPSTGPQAAQDYVTYADDELKTELEAAQKLLEVTQEENEEVQEKSKPKKRGRPKGVKIKAKAKATSKQNGKKPKKMAKESTVQLDDFGFRKGSIRSKATALYSRVQGATLSEIKSKLGSVQYNALTALKGKGFKVTSKEEDGVGNRPATRFYLHAKKR